MILWVLTILVFSLAGHAQDIDDALKPVTQTYAFKNATIIPAPGEKMEAATIVIKNGLIHAMGSDITIPAGARVIEADSMFVYAGFIDGLSTTGVPRPEREQQTGGRRGSRPDGVNPGNPPRQLAGVTPELQVRGQLKHDDKSVSDLRKLGFTAAHVVPRGRMLPGKGSVIILAGDSGEDMLVAEGISQFIQFSPASGVFPGTLIGVISKFHELYRQTEQLNAHMKAYQANPQGMPRPDRNDALEAMIPVVEGELPLFFEAPDVKSIYRVMRMQKELGFQLVITGAEEAWYVTDEIKASNTPIVLSLELPKKGKEKKEKDKEEDVDKEMEMLQERASERMTAYESQAAALAKAGIMFGFSTMEASAKDIRANLGRMIEQGLTADQALAALTTTPAKMLGVDRSMGSLKKGKMGNLVVTDKAYFDEGSNVRFVMIDGHLFEYEAKKKAAKKKADSDAEADSSVKIAGTWDYNMEGMGQSVEGTLEFSNTDGELSGTLSNSQMPGDAELVNLVLEGNTLTFDAPIDFGGQSITLEFEVVIEGDELEGSVTISQFGQLEIEAYRKGDPD